jgi:hypothetical protein
MYYVVNTDKTFEQASIDLESSELPLLMCRPSPFLALLG